MDLIIMCMECLQQSLHLPLLQDHGLKQRGLLQNGVLGHLRCQLDLISITADLAMAKATCRSILNHRRRLSQSDRH